MIRLVIKVFLNYFIPGILGHFGETATQVRSQKEGYVNGSVTQELKSRTLYLQFLYPRIQTTPDF